MKNLTKILANLKKSFGFEPFIDDQVVAPEQPPAAENPEIAPTTDQIEVPWSLDQNTAAVACGFTEFDIIKATLCGEAGRCGIAGMMRVWQVILNRAVKIDAGAGIVKIRARGVVKTDSDYVGVVIKPYAFSCWNKDHPCHAGDAFVNCTEFKKRMDCLVSRCGETVSPGMLTSTPGALEQLGFTPTEGTQVSHYMTLGALANWPYVCQELKDAVAKASGGKKSWTGCVTVECKGKTHKACSDGCHVFISNVQL